MRIHEEDFITIFATVIINAIHNMAFGIENGASFASKNKRFHPYGEHFSCTRRKGGRLCMVRMNF